MNKKEALALCEKHGEFYIHYRKLREGGTTYLQGTTEFDVTQDKYVAARLAKENLKEADDKHILVFSRSSDKFRYIFNCFF